MTTLRIEQTRLDADRFRADVELDQDGRKRSVRADFPFSLSDSDSADLRWYMEDYLTSPFEPEQQVAARVEGRLRDIGEGLFNALFTTQKGQFLWGSIRENLSDVRVEVVSEIQDATTVPWELLREPGSQTALAVEVCEFVRSHPQARRMALESRSDELPIRVLLVICRPGKNRDVPFRSVASRLVKALTDDARQLLQLDVLRPATFDRLAEVLRQARADGRPYHVVHFDGHGAFLDLEDVIRRWDAAGGDMPAELADVLDIDPQSYSPKTVYPHQPEPGSHGYLVFENPLAATNTRLADGGEIGKLLVDTQVPVLVLNACRSAHAETDDGSRSRETSDDTTSEDTTAPPNSHESGYDGDSTSEQVRAFGSLAHQVSHEGVSGVVAMRYNVYVVTAAEFVADLYAELLQGRSLGQASTLARKGLADNPLRDIGYDPIPLQDWPVPVVFESYPIRLFPTQDGQPKLELQVSSSRSAEAGSLDPSLPRAPAVGFFGRDETLLALDRAFDTQSVVLLHAFAGSGKTTVAAEFARWYALTGGVDGPVLFTSFETHRPLARVLDRIGEVFGPTLEQNGIQWLALDDDDRRDMALQVLRQIPVLWLWDNVEPVMGFPGVAGVERSEPPADSDVTSGETGGSLRSTPATRDASSSDTVYTSDEQQALVDFLQDASQTKAKFLLTSRRDEQPWLGDLPRRIPVGPMPMHERVQLAKALAEKHGVSLSPFAPRKNATAEEDAASAERKATIHDWRPLLRFTEGNPLTLTVVVGQALRDGLRTHEQIEDYVSRLRSGEAAFDDQAREGRSRSLGASLSYGFEHAFDATDRRRLAVLHLFQGFIDVDAMCWMGDEALDAHVPELHDLTREAGIHLLDRAAEVGLLTPYGGGYYAIHPALPWFFKSLFDESFGVAEVEGVAGVERSEPPDDEPDAETGGSLRSTPATQVTRAFVAALGELGNHYWRQYNRRGNRDVIDALTAEEANLLHARRLARQHGWWRNMINTMQGLKTLYDHTGRRAEWQRLVEEIVPDFVDPTTDGPLPDRDADDWSIVTQHRVRLAREQRDWPLAERLQRLRVELYRQQVKQLCRLGLPARPSEVEEDSIGDAELVGPGDPTYDVLRTQLDRLDANQRNTIRSLVASVHELGEIQREQNHADCVTSYREALDLAELLDLPAESATAAFNLGGALKDVPDVRDLAASEQWYRRSLNLFEERDRVGRAKCHNQLGSVAFKRFEEARAAKRGESELRGHVTAALAAYQQALDLLPANAVNDLAVTHNQLGAIYGDIGDFDNALSHYRDSIRLQEDSGNLYGAGQTRFNVALALLQSGRVSDAREYARAALRNFAPYGPGAADDVKDTQQLLAHIEQQL